MVYNMFAAVGGILFVFSTHYHNVLILLSVAIVSYMLLSQYELSNMSVEIVSWMI